MPVLHAFQCVLSLSAILVLFQMLYFCHLFVTFKCIDVLNTLKIFSASTTEKVIKKLMSISVGYSHIPAMGVCAALKGMVFKQFSLG